MSVNIRNATLGDAKGISDLIIPLTKKYVCPTCDKSAQEILINSMSEANVANYLSDNYQYFVAVNEKSEIIGVAGIRDSSHLYHLFVSDNYQRQGLSRKLWERVKTAAMISGNSGRFTVNSAVNAEKIYLSFGFIRIDGIRNRDGMIDVPMVLETAY
ncbi:MULTISPECIES: GNAT family N-acetyltransferase [Vibrio]|uniref:GNAT family N-acetyltransferase n=1 Tax=Vibrio ostreae TaxID=2841925 RepID=A0A975U790_9VIBR|nr:MULTISPECIES: GNAT family N-acetyltransferase [Vibrio]QXO15861.1 GNAT family N-acetyltransferase [Vibrio ostreae]